VPLDELKECGWYRARRAAAEGVQAAVGDGRRLGELLGRAALREAVLARGGV